MRASGAFARRHGDGDPVVFGGVSLGERARAVAAAVVDDDGTPVRVGLGAEAAQQLVEPRLRVQDGNDDADRAQHAAMIDESCGTRIRTLTT